MAATDAFSTTTDAPGATDAQLAGFGRRLGAVLLDSIISIAVGAVLVLGLGAIAGEGAAVVGYGLWILFALLYAPVLMARGGERNGQTWGKQALDIRVTPEAGGAIGVGTGLLREFVGKGLLGAFLLPTLVSLVMVLVRADKRAIHDLIAGTRVTIA